MKIRKVVIFTAFLTMLTVAANRPAHAVWHVASGLMAQINSMLHEYSMIPDFIISLLREKDKLECIGENLTSLTDIFSSIQGEIDAVSDTLGSIDFSPMTLVDELDIDIDAESLITIEDSDELFSWVNTNLVPDEDGNYTEMVENAKKVAVMRNGALTTQYSQAIKMYQDIEKRSEALYKYAAKVDTGDDVSYQAYLANFEGTLFQLDTDALYLKSLGSASKAAIYLAGNSDIFKNEK